MIVVIEPDGSVTLADPDAFTSFHVLAPGLGIQQIVVALGSGAERAKEDHVWVPIRKLHALGEAHGGPGWREGCDGMIEYASSRGWVDGEHERVLAHVESDD